MNVEIGAEAALFPEKEYISGIFVAVFRKFVILLSAIDILTFRSYFFMIIALLLLDLHENFVFCNDRVLYFLWKTSVPVSNYLKGSV